MVHQAFGSVLDASGKLDEARAEHGRRMHAREMLETAFGSLEIGFAGTAGFEGDPERVRFSTEGRGDEGTEGRGDGGAKGRTVAVGVEDRWLVMRDRGRADTLTQATAVGFDYLLSYGAQATWVQSWHSPASAPLAVRMRLRLVDGSVDTLLLVIGPRG